VEKGKLSTFIITGKERTRDRKNKTTELERKRKPFYSPSEVEKIQKKKKNFRKKDIRGERSSTRGEPRTRAASRRKMCEKRMPPFNSGQQRKSKYYRKNTTKPRGKFRLLKRKSETISSITAQEFAG